MLTQKESDIERLKQLIFEAGHEVLLEADHQCEFFLNQSDPPEPVSDTGRRGGGLTDPTCESQVPPVKLHQ